ncbi:MAG: hypothetical protein WC374_04785 [Phycisphaerae bacterium]|jgi:hypothetical protein
MENTIIKETLEMYDKRELKAHEQIEAATKELAQLAAARVLLMRGEGVEAVIPQAEQKKRSGVPGTLENVGV